MKHLIALAITAGASPLLAQDISLQLPIDCTLGKTCFIQQYTDRDPSEASSDFTCGSLSYDGHKGTDFALPTHQDRRAGVAVLAAADGTVRGVRDGMPDLGLDDTPPEQVEGRDCGNGVVIDHGDGWETQYCHMALGTVSVKTGDTVAAGSPLGQVGFSGRTQFPHLHLSVRHNGEVVDPFAPDTAACGDSSLALWAEPISYQPTALYTLGFDNEVPAYDAIKDGLPEPDITRTDPVVLWGFAFGSQPGDVMAFSITGPYGEIFDQEVTLDKHQAQYFRAGGRKAPSGGWPTGRYTGQITLSRDGKELDRRVTQVEIHR